MQRQDILNTLASHKEELNSLHVKALSLFGSVSRNDAGASSDVDILVELEPPLTFDRYMDLKLYLEDLLGTKVDLVTAKVLKPRIKPHILREAIRVA